MYGHGMRQNKKKSPHAIVRMCLNVFKSVPLALTKPNKYTHANRIFTYTHCGDASTTTHPIYTPTLSTNTLHTFHIHLHIQHIHIFSSHISIPSIYKYSLHLNPYTPCLNSYTDGIHTHTHTHIHVDVHTYTCTHTKFIQLYTGQISIHTWLIHINARTQKYNYASGIHTYWCQTQWERRHYHCYIGC